jgi:hypothetical protein
MLTYPPGDNLDRVRWTDVEQFNQLIYQLLALNVDVKAFEVLYVWTYERESVRYVSGQRVARQMEGLVTYARSVGIGLPGVVADQAG